MDRSGASVTATVVDVTGQRGARSILVRTGWGVEQEQKRPAGQKVEAVCDNLMHAVSVILANR
jgi:hypothetical protein